MPTNDERREVADGLRRQVKRLGPQMDAHEFAHYGADVIDSDNEILRWDQMMLRLADLIEPEERTCRNISTVPCKFTCSECHQSWREAKGNGAFAYCPCCGAMVMDK